MVGHGVRTTCVGSWALLHVEKVVLVTPVSCVGKKKGRVSPSFHDREDTLSMAHSGFGGKRANPVFPRGTKVTFVVMHKKEGRSRTAA